MELECFPSFVGVFARNDLPIIGSLPTGLVANTDVISKPGQHWVAIYIDETGYGYYFDSFGLRPRHKEFIDYLDNNCKSGWTYNKTTFQSVTASTCGRYCILFLYHRFNNYSSEDFVRLFSKNTLLNDVTAHFLTI
jgi:hypothetical protein